LVLGFYLPLLLLAMRDKHNDDDAKRQARKISTWKFWKLCLFVVFLFYPFVCARLYAVYNCTLINGVYFLTKDFDIICGSSMWLEYAMPMLGFVIAYSVGVPLFYFVILYRNRERLQTPEMKLQLGFLSEAYGDYAWFWELVDMTHKLTLTSIIPNFFPDFMLMASCMVGLCIYMMAILMYDPYVRKGDDRLHCLVQADLILLALCGLILQSENEITLDPTVDWLVSLLLITVIIFMVSVAFLIGARNVFKIFRMIRHKKQRKQKGELQLHPAYDDSVASAAESLDGVPSSPRMHSLTYEDTNSRSRGETDF